LLLHYFALSTLYNAVGLLQSNNIVSPSYEKVATQQTNAVVYYYVSIASKDAHKSRIDYLRTTLEIEPDFAFMLMQ
jgi:hypothetical protein